MAIRSGHYLHGPLETILQKVPVELKERMNRRQIPEDAPHDSPTEKALIRLHRQVKINISFTIAVLTLYTFSLYQTIKSLQVLQRTETQWNILLEKIFECEDTLKNQISRDRRFKRTFPRDTGRFNEYIYTPVVGECVL